MNTRLHTIVGFLILLSGLAAPAALSAQEIVIVSANPSAAEQGTALEVAINGAGFDKTVKEVKFLVHCEQPCADDTGGVVVNSFKVDSSQKITANVSVAAQAKLSSYDIAVSTRGRGGKGTTYRGENLFTVKLRPNQQLYSCDYFINNPLGTCTCQFVWNGDIAFLPTLIDDCVTSETLFLKYRIRGEGDGPGSQFSITAVPCGFDDAQYCMTCDPETDQGCVPGVLPGSFSGSSVIANTTHRAAIRWLDIRFDGVPRGCDNGIEAAVSFILDPTDPSDPEKRGVPDPKIPDPLNRNSLFNVNNIGIFSGSEPLCNAIEIVRTDEYTQAYSDTSKPEPARDWKVYATDNLIEAGSYEQAGIVMLGIMPSESINPPSVFGNTIGAATCGPAAGVLFGSLTPDPVNQVDGVVESNEIGMNGACADSTGIMVAGDSGGTQTTVKVNKNTITGAYTGVEVDGNVVHVNFSGNMLNYSDIEGEFGGIGISSDAQCTETKGKPNRISSYTTDFSDAGCSP